MRTKLDPWFYLCYSEDMEIWKSIPSLENFYEASSLGRIRRAKPGRNAKVGHIITQRYKKGTSYLRCRTTVYGKMMDHNVHRLVCEAFHGASEGLEVDHLNSIKDDNRPENLEWVTRSQNIKRAYERGYVKVVSPKSRELMSQVQKARPIESYKRGDQIGNSIFTEEEAQIVVKMSKTEKSAAKIARQLGFKYSRVWAIVSGKTWRHLYS